MFRCAAALMRFDAGRFCSRLLIGVWVFVAVAGCRTRGDKDDPVMTVKRFMAAVALGDSKVVWKYLGPRTRKALSERARLASAQTVGTVKLKGRDMISPGARQGALGRWTPKTYKVVKKSEKVAVVEVSAPPPRHVSISSGPVRLVLVAGSGRLVSGSPKPRWRSRSGWPVLGLTGVSLVFPKGATGRVTVGRKSRVELVRWKGKWRVELELP